MQDDVQEAMPDIKGTISAFIQNPKFIMVICGLVASLSFLMLVSFLALGWVDTNDSTISGMKIWLGSDDMSRLSQNTSSGLGSVRFIDRLLIVVPLGAITLITLAGMVITERMPTIQGLASMVAVALFLFFFPFFWQNLSINNWEGALEADNIEELVDTYKDFHSTGEQKLFGFLVSVVSMAGLGLYVAEQRGMLENIDYKAISETAQDSYQENDPAEYENY